MPFLLITIASKLYRYQLHPVYEFFNLIQFMPVSIFIPQKTSQQPATSSNKRSIERSQYSRQPKRAGSPKYLR